MKVKCSTVYGALTETASHRTHCELAWPAHTPELPASCFSARCDGLGALYIGDLLYDTLPLFIMSTPTYITMLDTANHHSRATGTTSRKPCQRFAIFVMAVNFAKLFHLGYSTYMGGAALRVFTARIAAVWGMHPTGTNQLSLTLIA